MCPERMNDNLKAKNQHNRIPKDKLLKSTKNGQNDKKAVGKKRM
jgi:hypothetical protein